MTRIRKILARFRNNPKNVHFHELETVLEQLGFVRITTNAGSHFKWEHHLRPLWYRAPRQNPVKSIYIKGLLSLVDDHFSDYL